MPLIDIPGDGTIDLRRTQVHDPRDAMPVSGFEEVPQLCLSSRTGGGGAMHDRRNSVAGGVYLTRIRQITAHDFNRQSTDPGGAGPLPHTRTHLGAARCVQDFGHPPADEPGRTGNEHTMIRRHSGSAPDRRATACRNDAAARSTLRSWRSTERHPDLTPAAVGRSG